MRFLVEIYVCGSHFNAIEMECKKKIYRLYDYHGIRSCQARECMKTAKYRLLVEIKLGANHKASRDIRDEARTLLENIGIRG